jgi:hypothetical protein
MQCALSALVHSDHEHLPSNLCILVYFFVNVGALWWADSLPRTYTTCQKYTHSRNFEPKQASVTTPKGEVQYSKFRPLTGHEGPKGE